MTNLTIEKARKSDANVASQLMYLAFDDLSNYLFGTEDLIKIEYYFSKLWINQSNRLSNKFSHVIRANEKPIALISCTEGELTSRFIFSSFLVFLRIDPQLILFALKHLDYLFSILTVKEAYPDEYYIFVLAVLPEYQGKGLGTQLLKFAETEAKKKGFKKLSLLVSAKNTNAIKFYEKNGFKKDVLINKAPLNNFRMIKILD